MSIPHHLPVGAGVAGVAKDPHLLRAETSERRQQFHPHRELQRAWPSRKHRAGGERQRHVGKTHKLSQAVSTERKGKGSDLGSLMRWCRSAQLT